MNYIKITFENITTDSCGMIVAAIDASRVEGFEESETTLSVYFSEDLFDEVDLQQNIAHLNLEYKKEWIVKQNWNQQWESNFEPIIVANEVGIRAHFHPLFENCKFQIEITPKMSFGTGHHATTQMMLEYGCETDFEGKDVLDFGCGTGVLAIFAAMKGARKIMAIDNDPWCVENAAENAANNHCSTIDISLRDLDSIDDRFDIILANINLNILLHNCAHLQKLLKPGGSLFLSGILLTDYMEILQHYNKFGFILTSQKSQQQWLALHLILT